MATIGDDKDKEESKDSAEASPSGNHDEDLRLHENSGEMTPNETSPSGNHEEELQLHENRKEMTPNEASPSVNHEEELQLHEYSEQITPNEEDNEAPKDNDNGNEEKISIYVNNEASVLMEESSDVNNGDQDEYNIESGDSQGEPGDDKDVLPGHPYEGKWVKVVSGELAGIVAPVKVVKTRGWLVLDHPGATKDVAAYRCEFLDEITLEDLETYYKGLGRRVRMTPHLRAQILRSGAHRKRNRAGKSPVEESNEEARYVSESKKRNANPQMNDMYSHSGLRLKELSGAAQAAFSRPLGPVSGNARVAMNMQTGQPGMLNYESANRPQRVPRPLPPIVLEATKDHELPPSLRHLDPNARVDIFNRKTGEIMSGEQAIQVKDLPEALLLHSEYEPIVPPSTSKDDSNCTREGRSARNVQVRNSVTPQSRPEISHYRGQSAVVIKGSYRGYIGVIDECTPGGWYVLKDVHHSAELGFPLVVGPDHIELIPTSCEEIITEMIDLVKDHNSQNMVTTYQEFITQHFSGLMQPLTDLIKTLWEEEACLDHTLRRYQTESGTFSRPPKEAERLRTRHQAVQEWKTRAIKEQDELFRQSASARACALRIFKEEEKAEASKKLSPMQLDAIPTVNAGEQVQKNLSPASSST